MRIPEDTANEVEEGDDVEDVDRLPITALVMLLPLPLTLLPLLVTDPLLTEAADVAVALDVVLAPNGGNST